MKIVVTCIFLMTGIYSVGQSEQFGKEISDDKPGFKIEFFALPALLFNHVQVGLSYKAYNLIEHNLSMGSWYELGFYGESFNLNLCYSMNMYLGQSKNYLPMWLRVSNTRRSVGFEDGYHPHTLRYSIGTGFGRVFEIGKKWSLRTEAGFGVAINQTNSSGKVLSLNLNLSEYSFDDYYPDQNPRIIPTFRFKLTFVRILGRNNP